MTKEQYPPTILPIGDEVKITNDNFSCILKSHYPVYKDNDKNNILDINKNKSK